MTEEKKCVVCGNSFYRNLAIDNARWRAKKCCSEKCSKYRSVPQPKEYIYETKECAICGTAFDKPKKDSPSRWKARKCCSKECSKKARNIKIRFSESSVTCEEVERAIAEIRLEKEKAAAKQNDVKLVDFSRVYRICKEG
jgi:hypothetical protein